MTFALSCWIQRQVVDLHMGVRESLLGKALNIGKRSLAVRKLKRKMGIDIAYSFGPSANMVNVFSGRSAQVWVGIRSYMDMENARKIRLFSKRADLVVCCSKRIEEEVRWRFGSGGGGRDRAGASLGGPGRHHRFHGQGR